MVLDGSNQLGAPRAFDVYRLRSRGSHRGSLESFAIIEGPPDLLTLELAQTWPEPHGSDVLGGPFPVVLETGWNAFIGYSASLDDVDASPRRLWKVPDSPPAVREVDVRDAMEPDRFREVVARLRVDPATDDADSVAERLASELDESRVAAFWARFQLETGDHLTDSGTVESRSNDAGIYRAAERALGSPASAGAKEWGERFLDVAERAASRLVGRAVEYSFISEGQRYQAEPESFSTDLHPLLVAGYFRGRSPGGRSGQEFFYVFGSTYYSGGAHRYPDFLARAEVERALTPRGLELAGEPQFQQLATASLTSGPKIELHYVA